jgi:hypothetical protein
VVLVGDGPSPALAPQPELLLCGREETLTDKPELRLRLTHGVAARRT